MDNNDMTHYGTGVTMDNNDMTHYGLCEAIEQLIGRYYRCEVLVTAIERSESKVTIELAWRRTEEPSYARSPLHGRPPSHKEPVELTPI